MAATSHIERIARSLERIADEIAPARAPSCLIHGDPLQEPEGDKKYVCPQCRLLWLEVETLRDATRRKEEVAVVQLVGRSAGDEPSPAAFNAGSSPAGDLTCDTLAAGAIEPEVESPHTAPQCAPSRDGKAPPCPNPRHRTPIPDLLWSWVSDIWGCPKCGYTAREGQVLTPMEPRPQDVMALHRGLKP